MYAKILIPIDSSGAPALLVAHAAMLAKAHGAEVFGLRVIPVVASEDAFFSQIQVEEGSRGARLRADALKHFAAMREEFETSGVRFFSEVVFDEKPEADVIAGYAGKHACDLIIMPTQPRSALSRWIMGNVEDKVRRRAAVPVLFVPVPGPTGK